MLIVCGLMCSFCPLLSGHVRMPADVVIVRLYFVKGRVPIYPSTQLDHYTKRDLTPYSKCIDMNIEFPPLCSYNNFPSSGNIFLCADLCRNFSPFVQ